MSALSPEESPMTRFAQQVRERRTLAKLTLAELADRSGVTKAAISKIERHETQPSLDVAARLAEALGVTLSEMLHQTPRARVVVLKPNDQVVARSHDGGIARRVLSPTFDQSGVEFIQFEIAAGASSGVFPPHRYGTEEYIFIQQGQMTLRINDDEVALTAGDSLYYEAQCTHELINTGRKPVIGFAVIKR